MALALVAPVAVVIAGGCREEQDRVRRALLGSYLLSFPDVQLGFFGVFDDVVVRSLRYGWPGIAPRVVFLIDPIAIGLPRYSRRTSDPFEHFPNPGKFRGMSSTSVFVLRHEDLRVFEEALQTPPDFSGKQLLKAALNE